MPLRVNIDTLFEAPTLYRIPYERGKKAKTDVDGSNLFCFSNIRMLQTLCSVTTDHFFIA